MDSWRYFDCHVFLNEDYDYWQLQGGTTTIKWMQLFRYINRELSVIKYTELTFDRVILK